MLPKNLYKRAKPVYTNSLMLPLSIFQLKRSWFWLLNVWFLFMKIIKELLQNSWREDVMLKSVGTAWPWMNIKHITLLLKCCVIMDFLSGFLGAPDVSSILGLGKAIFNAYSVSVLTTDEKSQFTTKKTTSLNMYYFWNANSWWYKLNNTAG